MGYWNTDPGSLSMLFFRFSFNDLLLSKDPQGPSPPPFKKRKKGKKQEKKKGNVLCHQLHSESRFRIRVSFLFILEGKLTALRCCWWCPPSLHALLPRYCGTHVKEKTCEGFQGEELNIGVITAVSHLIEKVALSKKKKKQFHLISIQSDSMKIWKARGVI